MNNFICPHCKGSLELQDRSLVCPNSHSFDLAREGYVNLLPLKAKKTRDPGDNSKMIMGRREFLNSGYYKPLAAKLAEVVTELSTGNDQKALDLGCGEGYYSGYIKNNNSAIEMMGLDISKSAVRYASKRYRDISYCVASSYDIPIGNDQIDIILRIYAPSLDRELSRITRKGGCLITVTPGKRHLYQLRETIYNEIHDHSEEIVSIIDFTFEKRIKLTYAMNLKEVDTVENLLTMTPFGWKISEENKKHLFKRDHWEIDCDFNIDIFRRN